MKKLTFIILCLAGLTLNAQTFTWGTANPSEDENGNTATHALGSNFYKINSKYNSDLFNRDVKATLYDVNTLNPKGNQELSVEQPAMGKAMITHLKMYQVKSADFIIFLNEFNTKSKQNELFVQNVNVETNSKSEPTVVTSMPGRNSDYFITQSDNKQFYAVLKHHSFDKKAAEKINVTLLNNEFKTVKEISFTTQHINRSPLETELFVSDKGEVYIVKNIDVKKEKPFKTLYFWDGKSDMMKETSLKFDNDYQIYQYKGHFLNGEFYLHALYTRIGSKAVQAYGGSVPAAGVLAAKFSTTGENIYIERNETGEIPGLNLKDFVFDNIKTWLFADKMFVSTKNKPAPAGSFNYEYDYTYKNNAIVFGKLDNVTGKLEWHKQVALDGEDDTVNNNGAYLSYLAILHNNELVLLYNDTQKTKVGNRMGTDRFTAIEKYDAMGNQISKSYVGDTGLELKLHSMGGFEENFDLDTSVIFKVSEGKYIVRAKSGHNEKYGYFNL